MTVTELDKETGATVTIFLLKNIKDITLLKKKILSGELDCCGVKPSLIVNNFQLIIAANKAACCRKRGSLKTKSLNTELLYNLSLSKNISKALYEFGIDEEDSSIIIVIFDENGEKKFEQLKSNFKGEICDIEEFNELADIDLITKLYRISERELEVSRLIDSVVSRISIKDFGSF